MKKGYIVLLDPANENRCLLTQVKKFSVHRVIHPVSMETVDYSVAVLEGKCKSNQTPDKCVALHSS